MPYNYIERFYGTRFDVGARVIFTEGKRRAGVVRGVRGDPQYVKVLFDDGHIGDCHPQSLALCAHCHNEPRRGWIEHDNNGPIVPCPVCNDDGTYPRG